LAGLCVQLDAYKTLAGTDYWGPFHSRTDDCILIGSENTSKQIKVTQRQFFVNLTSQRNVIGIDVVVGFTVFCNIMIWLGKCSKREEK
jgi:hypothetical protein